LVGARPGFIHRKPRRSTGHRSGET
jgi:hypothetical protein